MNFKGLILFFIIPLLTFATEMKDGRYLGIGRGYKSDLKTEVVILNNKISEINLIENNDTPVVSDAAFEEISNEILEIQGLGVDMVAGATASSNGFYRGILSALRSAGADIQELRKIKKEEVKNKISETIETDILVIGGGGAGLAAAASAIENGVKDVTVIEKMAFVGGNTLIAGGAYNAVDPKRQKPQGIEDSNEHFYKQTLAGGDNLGKPELVKILTENSYNALEWLEKKGLKFKDTVYTVIGAMYPRSHKPLMELGTGYIITLRDFLKENNAEILTKTSAKDLIVENGKVVGVIAESEDKILTIKAKGGVILATGGFGNNLEYRMKWDPKLNATIKSTNSPSATGDGIFLGEKVGANLVGMEHIQLLSLGDPKTGSLSGKVEVNVEDRIFVNKKGERFIAEDERRDVLTNALFEQPDATLYIIVDSKIYPTLEHKNPFNETIGSLIESNRAFTADTLEELATTLGMDPKVLVSEVNNYNEGVKKGVDRLGRKIMGKTIDKGPFFAGPRIPTIHHTMGGLEINEKTQVLDGNGDIIPGLYAAGEVTGGIHGTNRLGGNALPETIVFGRIAGKEASKNLK